MSQVQDNQDQTIEVDGVLRARCNSLGCPIQETDAGLIAFWRWFGDSKSVDDQDRPLVLYHGTYAVFEDFRVGDGNRMLGVFFTDDRDSAADWAQRKGGGGKPIIMKAYVKIDSPADECDVLDAERALAKRPEGFDSAALTRRLKREGMDGYLDESRYEDALEIVAFHPKQVRLVGSTFATRPTPKPQRGASLGM